LATGAKVAASTFLPFVPEVGSTTHDVQMAWPAHVEPLGRKNRSAKAHMNKRLFHFADRQK
jgi:hypothetical protein